MKKIMFGIVGVCAALACTSGTARGGELLFGYVNAGGGSQYIVSFDSSTPGTLNPIVPLTGMSGRFFDGIDFRPSTGQLYGYAHTGGLNGDLATIDVVTGAVTFLGTSTEPNGGHRGFDFNPVVDLVRIGTNAENNLRYNPTTGALFSTDTPLAYAAGDPNQGANPSIVHLAYSNNFAGAGSTLLYGIDSTLDILVSIAAPNGGQLFTVGPLGINTTNGFGGFDISGVTGIAYAALDIGTGTSLYTINLATGAATLVGAIGNGTTIFDGLSVQAAPEPSTFAMLGIAAVIAGLRLRRRR